jgi:hypothetical protein
LSVLEEVGIDVYYLNKLFSNKQIIVTILDQGTVKIRVS